MVHNPFAAWAYGVGADGMDAYLKRLA